MKNLIATLNIFIATLLNTQISFAQEKCVELFSFSKTVVTQQSSEEAEILIKLEALVKSAIDIRLNNFENPAQLQQAKETFAKELKQVMAINHKYLDVFKTMQAQKSAELITTSKEKARKEHEEKKEKEKTIKEATEPYKGTKKLVFHEINPGTFNMLGAEAPTTITKTYELAQTQTTQLQWSVIQALLGKTDPAKINPSNFKTGSEAQVITINGIDVQMKPDHPVETVSHYDVIEWITGLNRLSKEGNDQIQKEIQRVIPGHKKGHIYDLPTEAQWAFVMRNRGKNNDMHFDKTDDSELDQYAWYDRNAKSEEYPDGSTHAVATKKSRKIDRGDGTIVEFYDLEGNVWDWNKDSWDGSSKLPGGKDPIVTTGSYRVIRGGSWYINARYLRSGFRSNVSPGNRSGDVGFRLVRTSP